MPIIPFYHDGRDEELYHLMTYMHGVNQIEDVRAYNREAFGLVKLQNGGQIVEDDNMGDQ